jgi:hypothetical protein
MIAKEPANVRFTPDCVAKLAKLSTAQLAAWAPFNRLQGHAYNDVEVLL